MDGPLLLANIDNLPAFAELIITRYSHRSTPFYKPPSKFLDSGKGKGKGKRVPYCCLLAVESDNIILRLFFLNLITVRTT